MKRLAFILVACLMLVAWLNRGPIDETSKDVATHGHYHEGAGFEHHYSEFEPLADGQAVDGLEFGGQIFVGALAPSTPDGIEDFILVWTGIDDSDVAAHEHSTTVDVP